MGIFMTKKKREQMEEAKQEEKRNREFQAKVSIKRTLNEMKNQSKKLDGFKKNYIEKARYAMTVGNDQTLQLAKSGLKICLAKQKFLDSMIVNFEIAVEMNDMNKIIGQFVDGISTISDQMKKITSSVDLTKAQNAFDKAVSNNLSQYEALEAFMSTASESFENIDVSSDDLSDDEINKLIVNQAVDVESDIDKEIEDKISQVREKMTNI